LEKNNIEIRYLYQIKLIDENILDIWLKTQAEADYLQHNYLAALLPIATWKYPSFHSANSNQS
jgi:hypothetical protein